MSHIKRPDLAIIYRVVCVKTLSEQFHLLTRRSIDVKRNQPLQMCKVVIGSGKKGGALLKRFARTNQIAKPWLNLTKGFNNMPIFFNHFWIFISVMWEYSRNLTIFFIRVKLFALNPHGTSLQNSNSPGKLNLYCPSVLNTYTGSVTISEIYIDKWNMHLFVMTFKNSFYIYLILLYGLSAELIVQKWQLSSNWKVHVYPSSETYCYLTSLIMG